MFPPEFEAFYLAYPRKVEKKNAYLTWKQLSKKQQKEVIIAAKNYAKAIQREQRDEEYIKYPKVFLNPRKEIWCEYLKEPTKASDEWLRKKLEETKDEAE